MDDENNIFPYILKRKSYFNWFNSIYYLFFSVFFPIVFFLICWIIKIIVFMYSKGRMLLYNSLLQDIIFTYIKKCFFYPCKLFGIVSYILLKFNVKMFKINIKINHTIKKEIHFIYQKSFKYSHLSLFSTTQYPFSILYLPHKYKWILFSEKTISNASFQDFWCTNITINWFVSNRTINRYLKDKNPYTKHEFLAFIVVWGGGGKSDAKIYIDQRKIY